MGNERLTITNTQHEVGPDDVETKHSLVLLGFITWRIALCCYENSTELIPTSYSYLSNGEDYLQHLVLSIQLFLILDGKGFLVAQLVKNLLAVQKTQVQSLGLGRSPGEGNGKPLQYLCLENSMDRGAWWAACSPWVAKSQT